MRNDRMAMAFAEKRCLFMPYWPIGFPSLDVSMQVIRQLVACGADAVEIGVAFSDPLADGPILQEASQIALGNSVGVFEALDVARRLREEGCSIPLFLMGYLNPFLAYGANRLHREATAAGFDALIVPDAPPEHRVLLRGDSNFPRMVMPSFVSPHNTEQRLNEILEEAEGFLYVLSIAGTTGIHSRHDSSVHSFVDSLRRKTALPVAMGFGVKNPDEARQAAQHADAVIVGSALVHHYFQGESELTLFARTLASAIHSS